MPVGSRLLVAVAATCLLAGCLAGGSPGEAGPGTPPAEPAPNCADWVGFYKLDAPSDGPWSRSGVAIGYTLPADASVLFVAVEDGAVLGASHVSTTGASHATTADGAVIQLGDPLAGTHTIRVGAYLDANRNGAFDAGTDRPCREGGEPVAAGPRRVDFGSFD